MISDCMCQHACPVTSTYRDYAIAHLKNKMTGRCFSVLLAAWISTHIQTTAYTGEPYGQLVALGSNNANTIALVTIQMAGSVEIHWNRTFPEDFLTSQCQFGFDLDNSVIYLPSMYEVIGLDAGSGQAVVNYYTKENVYFYSFNYDQINKSIKGICSGRNTFNWCRMQVTGDSNYIGQSTYEFMLPDIEEPERCNYDVDFVNKTVWYRVDSRVLGISLDTGKLNFEGVANAHCIAHDWKTGEVFGVIVLNGSKQMGVVEIGRNGTNRNVTILPAGYWLESTGVCEVHAESRSMFILMARNESVSRGSEDLMALMKVNLTSHQTVVTPVAGLPVIDGSMQRMRITHFKFQDERV